MAGSRRCRMRTRQRSQRGSTVERGFEAAPLAALVRPERPIQGGLTQKRWPRGPYGADEKQCRDGIDKSKDCKDNHAAGRRPEKIDAVNERDGPRASGQ